MDAGMRGSGGACRRVGNVDGVGPCALVGMGGERRVVKWEDGMAAGAMQCREEDEGRRGDVEVDKVARGGLHVSKERVHMAELV